MGPNRTFCAVAPRASARLLPGAESAGIALSCAETYEPGDPVAAYSAGVITPGFESLILYVSDLKESRAFYAGGLGLPVVFEDDVIVVVGGPAGRVVLHRNDRGHDERGIFPAGAGIGGAAVRFAVGDPASASGRRRGPGSRFCGQPRTRGGGASSCSPIPMAARSSWPG
jgi:catechol 2,3-dioxygenase-like lactoylglutathione lyase family enzyme